MKTLGITYIWHGASDWDRVLLERPEVVIINPQSGPGEVKSDEWFNLVTRLKANGIKVLGYVALGYTNKPMANVIDEANKHKQWYGVDGIFWDEAPTGGALSYLRGVHGFARGKDKKGLSVFNPGVMPTLYNLFLYMISLPGSIWATFEGSAFDYYQRQPKTAFYMDRQAHIVYDNNGLADPYAIMSELGVGWGFVTGDTLPNPYDIWPT